ncbi:MAG: LLM class F420-dependent oxidoreductase [Acidimicrobiia bacterium]
MPPRLAVQIHPQHAAWDDIRRAVAEIEDAGFDAVYNWDHFYPLYGDPDGRHFEAWTMLGAWAEQTESIDIGCLVTCNSYRNPELLADMARTVDHASGGRLVFGIGSGWFERDYTEYGYEFGTAGSRLDDLAAAMPRVEARWSKLNPPPTRDIPVLIGGGGEQKTLRIVARHADIWHYFYNPDKADTYRHKVEVMHQRCAEIDRDPAEVMISAGVGAEHVDHADALAELGVGEITFGLNGPDYDLGPLRPWLSWAGKT